MKKALCVIYFFVFSVSINSFSQNKIDSKQESIISLAKSYSACKFFYPDYFTLVGKNNKIENLDLNEWVLLAYENLKPLDNIDSSNITLSKLFKEIAPGIQLLTKNETYNNTFNYNNPNYANAYWQYKTALTTSLQNTKAAFGYIHKLPSHRKARMFYMFSPNKFQLKGQKVKLSLNAKLAPHMDSAIVGSLLPMAKQGAKILSNPYIVVRSKDWENYELEFDYPIDAFLDKFTLTTPNEGYFYVSDITIKVWDDNLWKEVAIPELNHFTWNNHRDKNFLKGWETDYIVDNMICKLDTIDNHVCLKVNSIFDSTLYTPKVFTEIPLLNNFKLIVPTVLPTDGKKIYPSADDSALQAMQTLLKKRRNTRTEKDQAIAILFDLYGALLHDYPYRDSAFEPLLDSLFSNTLQAIESNKYIDPYNAILFDFMPWINDPHLTFRVERIEKGKNRIVIPPISIKLSDKHCIVSRADTLLSHLRVGDVIKSYNNIDISQLISNYNNFGISRMVQYMSIDLLLKRIAKDSASIVIERDGEIIEQSIHYNSTIPSFIKEFRQNRKANFGYAVKSKIISPKILYIDCSEDNAILSGSEKARLRFIDSLVSQMNKYENVIIDVRGRPTTSFLSYIAMCLKGFDFSKPYDIEKTAIYPFGTFEFDTVQFNGIPKLNKQYIQSKLAILVDYKTVSDPERILIRLQNQGLVRLIGNNTAGAAGAINKMELFEKCEITYTTTKVCDYKSSNPNSYQGKGIKPDFIVFPSPEGIKNGKDEILEKAINIIKNNK